MGNVCENPDFLSVMLIINNLILIIKILAPVVLIIITIVSFFKTTVSSDDNKNTISLAITRIFIAAFIFFIPNFVEAVISLIPSSDINYKACFTDATEENIKSLILKNAQKLVSNAESTYKLIDYNEALYAVNRMQTSTAKDNLLKRLDAVKIVIDEEIKKRLAEPSNDHPVRGDDDEDPFGGGVQSTGGDGTCQIGVVFTSEPDPSSAVNCQPGVLNPSSFVYPKDEVTGLPLGAWPASIGTIPTQLSDYKIHNSYFVFPTTPVNGLYSFVYDHVGMDIMAAFGTPIYSPVDGTMLFSEWGHTCNTGWDETAYTVMIRMSNPTNINGTPIDTVFLTHMSGIIYRCPQGSCNKTVKKGQLLGFVGNASGTSETAGWAPHLHITLFGNNNYDAGLRTALTEGVFDIPSGSGGYSIVAGG